MGQSLGKEEPVKYDEEKRKAEMLGSFFNWVAKKTGFSQSEKSVPQLPPPPPPDPLLAEMQLLQKQIADLKVEANNYHGEHINQEFRRIDAELSKLLIKLDGVKFGDRQEIRDMRRQAFKENELAAKILMEKIHVEDWSECDQCLQLR